MVPTPPKLPSGPHFGPICGQKGRFWVQINTFFNLKKNILLQMIFFRLPDGLGPSQTHIWTRKPRNGPIWACAGTSGRHATRLVSHIRAQPYLTPSYKWGGVRVFFKEKRRSPCSKTFLYFSEFGSHSYLVLHPSWRAVLTGFSMKFF